MMVSKKLFTVLFITFSVWKFVYVSNKLSKML